MRSLDTLNKSVLKLIYRFNTAQIKIPVGLFADIYKLILISTTILIIEQSWKFCTTWQSLTVKYGYQEQHVKTHTQQQDRTAQKNHTEPADLKKVQNQLHRERVSPHTGEQLWEQYSKENLHGAGLGVTL